MLVVTNTVIIINCKTTAMILNVKKNSFFGLLDYWDFKEQAPGKNFTPRLFAAAPSNNSTLPLPNLGLDYS